MPLNRWFPVALLAGAMVACSPATSDKADVQDSDADPCVASPGAAGCPCTWLNSACDSGFCIETQDGERCAALCSSACPADSKCTTASGPGANAIYICVPKYARLCNPCDHNGACEAPGNGGARCVDFGDDAFFCGASCEVNEDCPAAYVCQQSLDVSGQTSKQCVPAMGATCPCSPYAIQQKLSATCYASFPGAQCQGKRTCLPAGAPDAPPGGGLSVCLADAPTAEVCDDLKDNDCNGETDEGCPTLPRPDNVFVTEVFACSDNVDDAYGEWIELRNVGSTPMPLAGVTVKTYKHGVWMIPLDSTLTIPPDGYYVIGASTDKLFNGGVDVAAQWQNLTLDDVGDTIELWFEGKVSEQAIYTVAQCGKSQQLGPGCYPAGYMCWCTGDPMSPGAANHACPKP